MAKLKGELQADNGDVLHPHTSADVVFMEDGTSAEEKIKSIDQTITGIDVSGDVRRVVNERVNADTSKPLSTLINEWITSAKTAILNAISTLTTHVTNQHTATKNHVTANSNNSNVFLNSRIAEESGQTRNTISTVINVARDDIKSHMSNSMANPKIIKSIQRGVFTPESSRRTVTIGAVNMSKSLVISETAMHGTSSNYTNTCVLTNSTTLTFAGGTNYQVAWQVIEFY
ncbi:hypothetical protein PBV87_15160 [Niameybacter massiliensis]|uniref:Uncharacterized protein n=1 Tax=Holtiella tumoricola TaxID=3018743 RepID=A0AA42J1S6_9FIRM|nr:hypothetical protein [Holtiella tumoricola]MDA3732814.1 hypothetical protein [Holtiella tumoricola]